MKIALTIFVLCFLYTLAESQYEMSYRINLAGNDITHYRANLQKCKNDCLRRADCTHFSITSNKNCYLKKGFKFRKYSLATAVSGIKKSALVPVAPVVLVDPIVPNIPIYDIYYDY